MGELDPPLIFPMFKAVQSAFYAAGRDVARAEVLADLAASLGVDAPRFLSAFESKAAQARAQAHFRQAREWGIKGFPTLVLQQERDFHLITSGWQPLSAIRASLDAQLGN